MCLRLQQPCMSAFRYVVRRWMVENNRSPGVNPRGHDHERRSAHDSAEGDES